MQSKRSRTFIVFAIVLIMALTTGVALALKNDQSSTTEPTKLGSPYVPVTLPGRVPSFTTNDVRSVVHRYGFPLNPSVKDDRITSISMEEVMGSKPRKGPASAKSAESGAESAAAADTVESHRV